LRKDDQPLREAIIRLFQPPRLGRGVVGWLVPGQFMGTEFKYTRSSALAQV
jgi:hypothetical protein